jgi:NDP-sugar pyrophosphorylase family protein
MRRKRDPVAAFVLAAGYGERMLPLTAAYPKSLLPVLGIPLFEILVGKLRREGAGDIHCNLFHLPDAIESFAEGRGWPITFHRERELLGTGGGIGNMAEAAGGARAILLHNADVLSNISYGGALALHQASGALVTLVLIPAGPVCNVMVSAAGEVKSIGSSPQRVADGENALGYTGMAVLSPESLRFFPGGTKGGLTEILLRMSRTEPGSVIGWNAASDGTPYAWGEAGSPSGYLEIHRRILVDKTVFDPAIEPPPFPFHVGQGAVVEPGARWKGFCEIGARAVVERETSLEDCVVFHDTVVPRGSVHEREILFPGGVVKAVDR